MKSPRLFIGLPFSGGVKKNLVQLQDEARELMPAGWRWSDSEAFHVTLRFIGEVSDSEIMPICEAATEAASGIAPFEYRLEGLGVFPKPEAPRVLWTGVSGDVEPLNELHRRLDRAMMELGYRGDKLPWHPHVTLARAARGESVKRESLDAAIKKVGDREIAKVFAREVVTFNSVLTRSGPVYEVMARAPLSA